MAAVFPPPPPDPYRGINGLQAAWARWVSWLSDDLPRQWNELAALLEQLGGVGPPTGGGGGGTGGGVTGSVRNYVVPPEFAIGNLTPEQQITALGYVASWPSIHASGIVIRIPIQTMDRIVSPEGVAVGMLSWEVPYDRDAGYPEPFGLAAANYPGLSVWVPGLRVSF